MLISIVLAHLLALAQVSYCGDGELVLIQNSERDDEATVTDSANEDVQDVFEAGDDWQEVLPGQVIPSGLHVRINLSTGKKEAKRMGDHGGIDKINDDGGARLRTLEELNLAEASATKFNTEFEQVKVLVDFFSNASSHKARSDILEDLEYLLHQYDNARDFVNVGGLEATVLNVLEDDEGSADLRGLAALVFSACVQSHPDVQDKALNKGWLEFLMAKLEAEDVPNVRRRLLHAVACLVRGHEVARSRFFSSDGRQRLLALAVQDTGGFALKTLVLLADLEREEDWKTEEDSSWLSKVCQLIADQAETFQGEEDPQRLMNVLDKLSVPIEVFSRWCLRHEWSPEFSSSFLQAEERLGSEEGEHLEQIRKAVAALKQKKDEL